jgi:hypothetical protein
LLISGLTGLLLGRLIAGLGSFLRLRTLLWGLAGLLTAAWLVSF